jgi:hypothetical protein
MEAPKGPPNDLEQIKSALELLTGKVSHLITVVETRRVLVERFDDRLVRAEKLERALGTTALKLAAARAITGLPAAAFAGAVAGLTVAWMFLHAATAFAK